MKNSTDNSVKVGAAVLSGDFATFRIIPATRASAEAQTAPTVFWVDA